MKNAPILFVLIVLVLGVVSGHVRAQEDEIQGTTIIRNYTTDSVVVSYKDNPNQYKRVRVVGSSKAYDIADLNVAHTIAKYNIRNDVASVQHNYIYSSSVWDRDIINDLDTPDDYELNAGNPLTGKHWYYEAADLRKAWNKQDCLNDGSLCGGDAEVIVAIIDTGLAFENYSGYLRDGVYSAFPGMFSSESINLYTNPGEVPTIANPNRHIDGIDSDGNGYIDDRHGIDAYAHSYCDAEEVEDPPCSFNQSRDAGHPNDDRGHGTFVTGLIASLVSNASDANAYTGSVSPAHKVSILPIKANFPDTNDFNTIGLVAALDYAIQAGADIINFSLAGSDYDPALHAKLIEAYDAGIFIVASSGNTGTSTVRYPAAYSQVFAVGAANPNNTRSSYSNYGTALNMVAYVGSGSAQGTAAWQGSFSCYFNDNCDSVLNPYLSYEMGYSIGTSFASPQVAAAAALIKSYVNELTPAQIAQLLEESAVDIGPVGFDNDTGHGVLNFYNAFSSVADNQAPLLTFVEPQGNNDTADESFTIIWDATDPEGSPNEDIEINFYLDDDTDPSQMVALIPGCRNSDITTKLGTGLSCQGDFHLFPNGNYYIQGCIKDIYSNTTCYVSDQIEIDNSEKLDSGTAAVSTDYYTDVLFSTSFTKTPVVYAITNTEYGTDMIYTEIRDITTSGFKVRARENDRSGYDNKHAPAHVGWIAVQNSTSDFQLGSISIDRNLSGDNPTGWNRIYFQKEFSTTPKILVMSQSHNGGDLDMADIRNVTNQYFDLRLEEPPGWDGNHIPETFAWIAFEDHFVYENGLNTTDHNWKQVSFTQVYDQAPIVLAQIQTENGGDPAEVDIRNITPLGFEYRIEEDGLLLDQLHANETISWLAVPRQGADELWGEVMVDHNWINVMLPDLMSHVPAVIAKVASENGGDTVEVDLRRVETGMFSVRIEEDLRAGWDGLHTFEKVVWYAQAVDPDPVSNSYNVSPSAINFESDSGTQRAGLLTKVDHNWFTYSFAQPFSSIPLIFFDIQSENGGDTSMPDIRNLSETGFQIRVEEDVIAGWDGSHTFEKIGWIAFETPNRGIFGHVEINRLMNTTGWNPLDLSAGSFSVTPYFVADIVSENGGDTVQVDVRNLTSNSIELRLEEEPKRYDGAHTFERINWWAW
ncbi:S8 family serine peptidase [Candidatus Dojkabacteria bacterium]|uniref:S8 family serine peptidase n=1 Tax=Candidatus Dojkabacteria bacterium TaxID=2099670 RepID=A0A952AL62_9BACT|nr:S8 family serine peptidase [Candidatus Dojkabacteria bacterium]